MRHEKRPFPRSLHAGRRAALSRAFALAMVALLGLGASPWVAGAAQGAEPGAKPGAKPRFEELLRLEESRFAVTIVGIPAGSLTARLSKGDVKGAPVLRFVSEMVLDANLAGTVVQRTMRTERVYEYRDGGRLLSFTVERAGDGGEERIVGTCSPEGVELVRTRPGRPQEKKRLPPTKDHVEAMLVAEETARSGKSASGYQLDTEETMTDRLMTTELIGRPRRNYGGVELPVAEIKAQREGEAAAMTVVIGADFRELEFSMGQIAGKRIDGAQESAPRGAGKPPEIDLFKVAGVLLAAPIPESYKKVPGSARYRIGGLPKAQWRKSVRQAYSEEGGATILTVYAAKPTVAKNLPLALERERPEFAKALESNFQVEAEAPEIVALAKKVAGDKKNAWVVAKRLNAHVFSTLGKAYGASNESATDVLEAGRGDCTEHSLLMVSLARALGIPARRVNGLVYGIASNGAPAFMWHQWVELYTGEWVAMDPTFGQEVADATHLEFGGEGQSGDVAALMGALQIELLGKAQSGSKGAGKH